DTAGEPKDHFKKKTIVFDHIRSHNLEYIKYLRDNSKNDPNLCDKSLSNANFNLIFLYVSKKRLNPIHLSGFPHIKFWDYTSTSYFHYLTKSIKKSARYELFRYFGITAKQLEIGAAQSGGQMFNAFVIPEAPSGYPENCKLVTFYIDPASLLERAYVLRRENWEAKDSLYQRMVKSSKIKSMRIYLAQFGRVYANNVVVALPNSAQFYRDDKQINKDSISEPTNLSVWLKQEFNSIGIIDGQHRVYSYHESSDEMDKIIEPLRDSQHLLATGIMFPENCNESVRTRLQAQLFLEINDKQTRTSSSLRQSIKSITEPFTQIAIAKRVIDKMATVGPLAGVLEIN
ncbi:MAG: DGQHR domain-containing protein, partial [Nitrosotalea sp.]